MSKCDECNKCGTKLNGFDIVGCGTAEFDENFHIINMESNFCKKQTQADKIRSMSDEELFDFLFGFDGEAWSRTELEEWLQSEVENGN